MGELILSEDKCKRPSESLDSLDEVFANPDGVLVLDARLFRAERLDFRPDFGVPPAISDKCPIWQLS